MKVHLRARDPDNPEQTAKTEGDAKAGRRRRFGRWAALTLTTIRVLLGLVIVVLAWVGASGRFTVLALVVAALSDIYDGRIARRFGVDAAGLRRYDSIADTIFYLCVAGAVWIAHPEIVRAHAILLIAFASMQIVGHFTDVMKFGKDTTYHTWSGRVFSATLFLATAVIFWSGHAGPWLVIALVAGMIAHVDAFIISMILPEWRHDVHTISNALAIRRAIRQSQIGRTGGP